MILEEVQNKLQTIKKTNRRHSVIVTAKELDQLETTLVWDAHQAWAET